MRRSIINCGLVALSLTFLVGCSSAYQSSITFPSPSDIFVTTGDGNIQKPYTPIGQLIYRQAGFRIPLPILGLLPLDDVDPALVFRQGILQKVKSMGGDGVINVSMNWTPPTAGMLGLFANGGSVVIYGTVIKR